MSWASRRNTTRVEDRAYCLLGIFGVNMPLMYGEGERAFARLQEEIIKTIDDYSIFAWSLFGSGPAGVLSPSPLGFRNSHEIIPGNSFRGPDEAVVYNNKGIQLQVKISQGYLPNGVVFAVLPCCRRAGNIEQNVAIQVEPLSGTKLYFQRSGLWKLEFINPEQTVSLEIKKVWIQHGHQTRDDIQPQLAQAAASGNTRLVQLLLSRGWHPDIGTHDGMPPIESAVLNSHEDAVRLLLEYGAQVHHSESDRRRLLQLAVDMVDTRLVEEPLTGDVESCSPGSDAPTTLLHNESQRRCEGIIDALLDKGFDPDQVDGSGQTVMRSAVAEGKENVVSILLKKAKLEYCPEGSSQSLLSMAVQNGTFGTVRLLLDRGANMESRDERGLTPLAHAAWAGHWEMVELLLDRGADTEAKEAKDLSGRTALSQAAAVGDYRMVKVLLGHGADMESRDEDAVTPLIHAVYTARNPAVVELMLTEGAGVEARDDHGRTALSWAAGGGRAKLVRLMLEHGADPETRDNSGCTPLMWAAVYGYPSRLGQKLAGLELKHSRGGWPRCSWNDRSFADVVKVLLAAGANSSISNIHGSTAQSLAILLDIDVEIIKCLETGPPRKRKRLTDDEEPKGQPPPKQQPGLGRDTDAASVDEAERISEIQVSIFQDEETRRAESPWSVLTDRRFTSDSS